MQRLQRDAGTAAVEFVLLFPFMLLLMLFFIEFGFMLHNWITVNNAAAEAARYASVGNLPSVAPGTCEAGVLSVEGRAVEASGHRILCSEVAIGYRRLSDSSDVQRGDGVVVRITHAYHTVTGFGGVLHLVTGGVFPDTLTMAACADTRLETRPARQSLADSPACGG